MARDVEIIIGAKEEVTEAANRANAALRSVGSTANEAGSQSSGAAAKSELAWLKKGVGVGVAIMALRKMITYAELAGGASAELAEQMEKFNKVTEDIKVNIGAFVIGAGAALLATLGLMSAAWNSIIGYLAKFISYILPFTEFIPALKSLKDGLEGVAANSFDAANAAFTFAENMDKTTKSVFGLIGKLEGKTEATKKDTAETKKNNEEGKRKTALDREAQRLVEAELKRQSDIEGVISKTAITTARLGATKEELINLQLIEAEAWNWSIDQIDRYKASLVSAALKEKEIAADKEAAKMAAEAAKALESTRGGTSPGIESSFGLPSEVGEMFAMQTSLEQLQIYHAERLAIIGQYSNSEAEFLQAASFANLQIETQANQMRLASAMNTANMMMQVANILYVAGSSKNKALFVMMKAFAIGQAIMAAYQASALALAHPPGPPTTIPLAATALKMGLLNAGMIAAQTVAGFASGGGSGGGGGIGSGGGGGIGTTGVSSPVPFEKEEPKQTQAITLNIYNPLSTQNWAEITENNILPALKAASDRNIVMNVQTVYA